MKLLHPDPPPPLETAADAACQAALDRGDPTYAEWLGRDLDAPPRPAAPTLGAALWYAEHGLRVFPLEVGGKRPLPGSRGCKDATTDPERIRAWWAADPTRNLGLATGHLVDVIDVDGSAGVHSWAQLGDLPPVLGTVSTPRAGGTHLYVAATGDGNAAGLWPGIDYRGRGGYVVAPPSRGAGGVPYRWRRPLAVSQLSAEAAA